MCDKKCFTCKNGQSNKGFRAKCAYGYFPGFPVVKTPHFQFGGVGVWIQSLDRELRSHMMCDIAKKT